MSQAGHLRRGAVDRGEHRQGAGATVTHAPGV